MEAQVDQIEEKIAAEAMAATSAVAPAAGEDAALCQVLKGALAERLNAAPVERLKSVLAGAVRTVAARNSKP